MSMHCKKFYDYDFYDYDYDYDICDYDSSNYYYISYYNFIIFLICSLVVSPSVYMFVSVRQLVGLFVRHSTTNHRLRNR